MKMPDLMGILEYIEPIRTIQISQGNASILDQVEAIFKSCVIRSAFNVHIFIAAKSHVTPVLSNRRCPKIVA